MLLVLIALAITVVMAITFLSSQSTSIHISQNISNNAQARQIAETAMALAIREIKTSGDWRTTRTDGVWIDNQPLLNGSFTLIGQDGRYDSATNSVLGDGDLANNSGDLVTLTAIGRFQGTSYTIRTVVSPPLTVASARVLMIVADASTLTPLEQSRKLLIESWGWSVMTLSGNSSAEAYATALENAHVVYVPDDGGSNIVGTRLASAECGVVIEDGDMFDEMGLASEQTSYTGTTIRIVDTTHYITSPFAVGDLVIANTSGRTEAPQGTVMGGVRPLAWWPGTERRVVAAMDAGQSLIGGAPSPGRRAISPFSGFSADDLTDEGKALLKRMLEWNAQSAVSTDTVTALGSWVKGTTVNVPSGEDRLLIVTAGAETHTSLTSMTYGNQPMTLVASAYESTGVGARSYIFCLGEAGLKAATDKVLRPTWTSGTREDASYTSRAYKNVSQANPIRTTQWATNAGPPTITCDPVTVARGDVVVSAVRVGVENRTYTWASPMVKGLDDQLSTSTHTTADYAVPGSVSSVTASTSCTAPNRQAMVTAVLQPRSLSSGGIIPTLLALYEFDEQAPEVSLVGHWPLDDDGTGGTLAIQGSVTLSNNAVIDGYRSSSGAYSGANSGREVTLVTNANGSGHIALTNNAIIKGSTYNRPGANPYTVVSIASTAQITGNRYEQSVQFSLPSSSAPTGMPATQGNKTYNSGSVTFSSDQVFQTLTLNNGAVINIQGDIRIQLTDDLIMNGNSQIVIPNGSRLRLYVNDDITLVSTATINAASNAPERFELYTYGSNPDVSMSTSSSISGILQIKRNLKLADSATLYGSVQVGGTLILQNNARVSIDLDQAGFGVTPVADATGTNHAQAHDDVTFDQSGARAFTGKSLRFDGSNDFVRIAHHDNYLLNHGAISFWFNSESLSGTRAIFSKDSSGYDTGGQLHIYTTGTTLKARIQTNGASPYGSGDEFEASATGLSTNTWYHVTVTFGAGGLRLYLNGAHRQTVNYPGGLGSSSGGIGNYEPIVLGAGTGTSGDLTHLPVNEHFMGRIDDVRIYNAVLDATQISRIYQGQDVGARTEPSYLVVDSSGLGTALNLSIDNTQAVTWINGGGLKLNQATVLRGASTPDKIRNGVSATGEFTIEIITKAASDAATGRLFWYGPNSGNNTNIDIYQNGNRHTARLRTSATSNNPSALNSDTGIVADTSHHILLIYGKDLLRIYRDGAIVAEQSLSGSLLNWDSSYGLTLGNLPLGTSAWLGTFERVAIYDRAMNQTQTDNLFQQLPPGDGGGSSGGFNVVWVENP